MRRLAKIVSLLLAVTMLVGLFASCNNHPSIKDGEILVVYNGIPVYESEVQDIINYNLVTKMNQNTTEEQMKIMMGEAIGTYVQFKTLELDFNERKIKVDEKALKERVKAEKAEIEKNYEGGYKGWMKNHGVSENFLAEEVRRYVLTEMYYNTIVDGIKVTEEEMKAYMNLHANDFYHPAGYGWTIVFREVKDITNDTECNAAEQEAQEYINKILKGDTTIEEVKVDLLEKYTAKDGYGKAEFFSGTDFTDVQGMVTIKTQEELDAILADIDEVYKDRDPKADKTSKQYANYMNWIGERYEAEVYFALQQLEKGQVYSKPVKSFVGYGIIRLDSVVKEASFDDFEDVKGELSFLVLDEKMKQMMMDHLEELHHKYDVQYLYNDL